MSRRAARIDWVNWLKEYGADKFYDAFLATAQGARSECIYCGEDIFLDIVDGGGVPDWGSSMPGFVGLDFGCPASPDTDDEGTGGHFPVKAGNTY